MAVWQFKLILIPKEKLNKKFVKFPDLIEIEKDENLIKWEGFSISIKSLDRISKIFPLRKSWSDDIKQYGDLDKSCIELLYNDDLEEVSIRIDLREINKELFRSIIEFIIENDALAITSNGKLVEPSEINIINEIKNSDAFSYVVNPSAFLESLESE